MTQYQDIEIVCLCGTKFNWSAGEQKFLQSLIDDGKTNRRDGSLITFNQPKRCKECRLKRRQEKEAQRHAIE